MTQRWKPKTGDPLEGFNEMMALPPEMIAEYNKIRELPPNERAKVAADLAKKIREPNQGNHENENPKEEK